MIWGKLKHCLLAGICLLNVFLLVGCSINTTTKEKTTKKEEIITTNNTTNNTTKNNTTTNNTNTSFDVIRSFYARNNVEIAGIMRRTANSESDFGLANEMGYSLRGLNTFENTIGKTYRLSQHNSSNSNSFHFSGSQKIEQNAEVNCNGISIELSLISCGKGTYLLYFKVNQVDLIKDNNDNLVGYVEYEMEGNYELKQVGGTIQLNYAIDTNCSSTLTTFRNSVFGFQEKTIRITSCLDEANFVIKDDGSETQFDMTFNTTSSLT